MKQNNFQRYATPLGRAFGNLTSQIFKPQGNKYQNDYYAARTGQAEAEKTRAETTAAYNEALRTKMARQGLNEGISGLFGPRADVSDEEYSATGNDFSPRPQITQQMHEQNYIPQILSNYMGQAGGTGGLDPADLGSVMRAIIMNNQVRSPGATEGAFLGAGGEFKAGASPNALSTPRQDELQTGIYNQATNINDADNTRIITTNTADNRQSGLNNTADNRQSRENNARDNRQRGFDNINNNSQKMEALRYKTNNPESFTLADGSSRYDSDGKLIAANDKEFNSTSNNKIIKLKPGESAFDPNGREIASVDAKLKKPLVLKPGEIATDLSGKVIARGTAIPGKAPVNKIVNPGQSVIGSDGTELFKAKAKAVKPITIKNGETLVSPDGVVLFEAKPNVKPLTRKQGAEVYKTIEAAIYSAIMQGVPNSKDQPLPPGYSNIVAKANEDVVKNNVPFGQAISDAMKNFTLKWSPDRKGISGSRLFGSDAGWVDSDNNRVDGETPPAASPAATPAAASQQATSQQSLPPLAIGAVVGNFRYKGGPPNDRTNWEPI